MQENGILTGTFKEFCTRQKACKHYIIDAMSFCISACQSAPLQNIKVEASVP